MDRRFERQNGQSTYWGALSVLNPYAPTKERIRRLSAKKEGFVGVFLGKKLRFSLRFVFSGSLDNW
jgi:hypothetical protein